MRTGIFVLKVRMDDKIEVPDNVTEGSVIVIERLGMLRLKDRDLLGKDIELKEVDVDTDVKAVDSYETGKLVEMGPGLLVPKELELRVVDVDNDRTVKFVEADPGLFVSAEDVL